ncbi:MAG: imidazole glycerol phosphate synthase subunit HisH, partial [Balneolaceae bacterium]
MIGIIKYKAGNLASVSNALDRLNAKYIITDEAEQLEKTEAIIFPGVGHAAAAMDDLRSRDLDIWLLNTKKPVLGICLGMQLLFDSSEEGNSDALGIIPGVLKKFDSDNGKVPHMGWNSFHKINSHDLLKGIKHDH